MQHALCQVIGQRLEKALIRDTFQSIKGRGTSDLRRRVEKGIKDNYYYIKIDLKKFYPSVNNTQMKKVVRQYIKDENVLWLLDDIIDSTKGLPIGNYTSQLLGNLYLNSLDWYIKQELKIKNYYRYCDDLLLLLPTKDEKLIKDIIDYTENKSKATIKSVDTGKIKDGFYFVGFNYTKHTIKVSNRIRCNSIKSSKNNPNENTIYAYYGFYKQSREIPIWYNIFKENL